MGGLDRDTRQVNKNHWAQLATTVANPWFTWPEPLSALGADAQVTIGYFNMSLFLTIYRQL
jgi:hypothetical protein